MTANIFDFVNPNAQDLYVFDNKIGTNIVVFNTEGLNRLKLNLARAGYELKDPDPNSRLQNQVIKSRNIKPSLQAVFNPTCEYHCMRCETVLHVSQGFLETLVCPNPKCKRELINNFVKGSVVTLSFNGDKTLVSLILKDWDEKNNVLYLYTLPNTIKSKVGFTYNNLALHEYLEKPEVKKHLLSSNERNVIAVNIPKDWRNNKKAPVSVISNGDNRMNVSIYYRLAHKVKSENDALYAYQDIMDMPKVINIYTFYKWSVMERLGTNLYQNLVSFLIKSTDTKPWSSLTLHEMQTFLLLTKQFKASDLAKFFKLMQENCKTYNAQSTELSKFLELYPYNYESIK